METQDFNKNMDEISNRLSTQYGLKVKIFGVFNQNFIFREKLDQWIRNL